MIEPTEKDLVALEELENLLWKECYLEGGKWHLDGTISQQALDGSIAFIRRLLKEQDQ